MRGPVLGVSFNKVRLSRDLSQLFIEPNVILYNLYVLLSLYEGVENIWGSMGENLSSA